MNKYDENLQLIRKAMAFEPVDRIPVAPCANAYYGKACGLPLKTYITDFDAACTVNLKCLEDMEADATQNVIFSPFLLPAQWLSKVATPGNELGDDDMWQIVEKSDFMKQEEYQIILDKGFEYFFEKFKKEKLEDNNARLESFFAANPAAYKRFYDAGIPCICDFLMITPFEFFCGGRGLENFFADDLFEEPDMMDEVFHKTMEYTLKIYQAQMDALHPIGVWIGGWRTSPQMLSPEMWNRFVWPYFKEYTDLCLKNNVIPIFHLDSCWDAGIERFLEMPAQKCIIALDGTTDIRRARKILGNHMCILGDVPAQLLAFGSPDDVYKYVTDVIDDIGPLGYIAASGCDIPSNAKPENVKAMSQAAHDYIKNHPGCC